MTRAGLGSLALLVGAGVALVGYPLVAAVSSVPLDASLASTDPERALRTLGVALAIGVLSTVVAMPMALAGRAFPSSIAVLPVLVPAYLAYAGLGAVRDPTNALGLWLGSGPAWRSILAGRVLAVVSLALWSAPISFLVLRAGLREVDPGVLDAHRLDARGPLARLRFMLALLRAPVAGAIGLVSLVMLGSAIPLHLAQVDTIAIRAWAALDELPPDRSVLALASAWPIVLPALVVSLAFLVLARRAPARSDAARTAGRGRSGTGAAIAAWAAWALALPVPLAILVASIEDLSRLGTFWFESGPALGRSVVRAAGVGAAGGMLAFASLRAGGAGRGHAVGVRMVACVFLMAGLVPGVCVGMVQARAWSETGASLPGDAGVVAAHLARFGFLPVIVGWGMAVREDPDLRSLRLIDAGHDRRAWWRLVGCARVGVVAGVALVVAGLSLHEIEATVVVEPPGGGSFAREILSFLHFFRMEQLGAGAAYIGMISVLLGVGATLAQRTGYVRERAW